MKPMGPAVRKDSAGESRTTRRPRHFPNPNPNSNPKHTMNDIIAMTIGAAIGGASCGFMAACLVLSHRMRRISIESWREAKDHYTKSKPQTTRPR